MVRAAVTVCQRGIGGDPEGDGGGLGCDRRARHRFAGDAALSEKKARWQIYQA
jgi:hypothetical protein